MKKRGFTLVELLVVLAITGILLAIVVPSYAFFVNTNRLAAVTNGLVSAIQLARSEAVKRGTRVTVCKSGNAMDATPSCDVEAAWQHGWLVFVDGGTPGTIDAGDTLLRVQDGAAQATITAGNYADSISYLPSGVSQGSTGLANGTFRICVMGNRRDIIINRTGRVRLDKGAC